MKKSLLIIALICSSAVMFAQGKAKESEQDSIKGYHPYKVEENKKLGGICALVCHSAYRFQPL